jgi:hypothetical protein
LHHWASSWLPPILPVGLLICRELHSGLANATFALVL